MFKKYFLLVSSLYIAFCTSAYAAIAVPASVDTTLGELQTAGLALADKIWPYMLAILGAFILLRLGKKFVSKIG